jgi:hypothetical protein
MFTIGGLSGVVLANASLDIAFHDKLYIYPYYSSLTLLPLVINNQRDLINDKLNNSEYIKMF